MAQSQFYVMEIKMVSSNDVFIPLSSWHSRTYARGAAGINGIVIQKTKISSSNKNYERKVLVK